jgi:hypothetical protein
MSFVLPFKLKVPGKDQFTGLSAVSTSFRFQGLLRLEGNELTIEWSGEALVQEVGAHTVRDDRLPLPTEQILVPVSQLYGARLEGGWWRPRLRLQARQLAVLSVVPSEEHGAVEFWYARADRDAAVALASALTAGIGMGSRAHLEGPAGTPPSGLPTS